MKEELDSYKAELESINQRLSNPDQCTSEEIKELSQRSYELSQIIEVVDNLVLKKQQLEEASQLINGESDESMVELVKDEISTLDADITSLTSQYHNLTREKDPNDKRNAILEIRAGTGGEEAALFASEIYRMYTRYAEVKSWKVEQVSSNRTGNGGYKEIIAIISGKDVYGKLKYENGVHRVQRVPETESSGRIHTSAISVVVMPEVDDVDVEIKDEELKIDVYRAGGPGGQSVNTTDSAVRITHLPSGIVVTCQDEKSQHKNKARALSILKSKLFEIELEKQQSEQSDIRKKAIKTGDRSAKIRTYNYPQSRITDHRIKKSWYNFEEILNGSLDDVIESIQEYENS